MSSVITAFRISVSSSFACFFFRSQKEFFVLFCLCLSFFLVSILLKTLDASAQPEPEPIFFCLFVFYIDTVFLKKKK